MSAHVPLQHLGSLQIYLTFLNRIFLVVWHKQMAASIINIAVVAVVQLIDAQKRVSSAFVASFKKGNMRIWGLSCSCSWSHQKGKDTDVLLKFYPSYMAVNLCEELCSARDLCRDIEGRGEALCWSMRGAHTHRHKEHLIFRAAQQWVQLWNLEGLVQDPLPLLSSTHSTSSFKLWWRNWAKDLIQFPMLQNGVAT